VFAVPGSIFQRGSAGTNRLIQEGAAPALSAADVLDALHLDRVTEQAEVRAVIPADPTEAQVLALLTAEPTHIDEIVRASALSAAVVASTLALLELKGLARQSGNMTYVLARGACSSFARQTSVAQPKLIDTM